jgi:hypothetical protein
MENQSIILHVNGTDHHLQGTAEQIQTAFYVFKMKIDKMNTDLKNKHLKDAQEFHNNLQNYGK